MKILSKFLAVAIIASLYLPLSRAAGTGLSIQVVPETHLDKSFIQLTFKVSNPGEIAEGEPVTVTAWVRDLPGQQIQFTAAVDALAGPSGKLPTGDVRWSGSMVKATGGAVAASCASGSFSGGAPQSLVNGWSQSGIASCALKFSLRTDSSWPTGTYTVVANIKLSAI